MIKRPWKRCFGEKCKNCAGTGKMLYPYLIPDPDKKGISRFSYVCPICKGKGRVGRA